MTEITRTVSQADEAAIASLLTGRRIVSAEIGKFKAPGRDYSWRPEPTGKLTLDDGTVILVEPNEGCGGCSAGWYELTSIAAVDNIITSVKLVNDPAGDEDYDDWSGDRPKHDGYKIFVFCGNTEINLLSIDGSDGNGYYGTGYELHIVRPAVSL